MEESLVILILNILFAIFIVGGFLLGLKGIKKAGLSFVCFVVAIVVAIFVTPLISQSIMQIKVTYNGNLTSLNDIILSYINNSEQIAEMTSASPTLKTLIQNVPLMVGNVFVFVALSYIFAFLGWIVYLILASVFIKNEKNIKDEKGNVVKAKIKKHRLLGGIVGALQGLILVFITFLPFSGIVGLVNDITDEPVSAQTQEESNLTPSAKFIKDNLPKEAQEIINAYSNSAVAKMSGVLNFDDVLFNNVSTVEVDNVKISLRTEVLNIAKVYDNVEFLFEIDLSSLNSLKLLNYDKLNNAIEFIFNSNILKATLPELLDYGFDKLLTWQDVQSNEDLSLLLQSIQAELKTNNEVLFNLQNEVSSLVNSCKIVVETNLLDEICLNNEEFSNENLKNIIEILTANDKQVFNQLIDNLFNSKALNKGVIYLLNYGLDNVELTLKNWTNDSNLILGRLNILDSSIVLKKAEVKNLLSSAINIMKDLIDTDLTQIKNDYRLIFELNLPNIVLNLGTSMNVIQKMTVFNDTGIYDEIIDALTKTQYEKYVDFAILKNDNIWLEETEMLSNVIEKINESNFISYVDKTDNGYTMTNDNIAKVLNNLTKKSDINGQEKTLIRQIIEPLYNSRAFAKILDFGFEQLNTIINNLGSKIGENVELGSINYEYIHAENEKQNIFAFVDNVAMYVKNLNLDEVANDPFTAIVNSDIVQLGSCMDFLKNSKLFANSNKNGIETNGIYTNLINALIETKYSKYVNFASFKDSDFSFNNEFSKLKSIVDAMLNKQIVENGNNIPLIEYIIKIGDDPNGWKVVFEQIEQSDLTVIFEPLMQSKIFEPIGVMVVNKINEQIKKVVGEYGDVITTVIESLDKEEIAQVIEVLGAVSEVITDITSTDFNLKDMTSGEAANDFGELLNTLQDNANKNGVFEQTYDAFIEYIKADEQIGSQVTEIIAQYPQDKIDWVDLISKLPKDEG